ncbi:MAG: hypothetical protein Q8L87_05385 [Anaerolineales bacterium]|jgi:hypothetical protein|nr:hypothetical protein [Anaerolineales bacterium]
MKSKKLSILLAALALVISTLACAIGGEPALDNVRTAKDQDGNQSTSVFATTETVYVVSDLSNGVLGNVVTSKWYAVDVADTEPNLLIDTAEIVVEDETFDGVIYFFFPPPLDGQWPLGTYKVEVLLNNVLISTVNFTVQ